MKATSRFKDLWPLGLQLRSQISTSTSLPQKLELWKEHQWISPPVAFIEGQTPPTALSWLRRRGPKISQASVFQLFRQRRVRFFDGEKVRHIRHSRELSLGDRILLPLKTIEEKQSKGKLAEQIQSVWTPNRQSTSAWDLKMDQLAEESKRWLLYSCGSYFVINKPENLPVQAGPGLRISLDRIYEHVAVRNDWPEKPRLVHRLDRMTTGALILARSADSASWLCQAFKENAHDDKVSDNRRFEIDKIYWAVLDARRMTRTKGTISTQFKLGSVQLASITSFELVMRDQHLAVVKLRPKTGRKHQLRLHCAHQLDAPILGDRTYSKARAQIHAYVSWPKETELEAEFLKHVYLHAHELIIKQPGKRPTRVVAPFPDHMQRVINVMKTKQTSF